MIDWADLVANGDIISILLILAMGLLTGGVITAIINNHAAKKRGISADAIQKEQNGISGLGELATAQDRELRRLADEAKQDKLDHRQEIADLKLEFNEQLDELREELKNEISYSNSLITQLIKANISPVSRPPVM